ncbi:uncharacterized protein LOC129786588 isoform X1 [Lutzomyia longipalpis]|uniref:uncharacterized protein LOC129786588 isoform X1 n=1 Tax=Lutzomyia longipalpis TaxID=7200 RepID=UPI0024836F81|nr:uncharacterized protein LOC129786588 isoform X1 [Lutzomyia longipalpis]XP_055677678.1 uncharacterized protein LOC129786588 isoform X1 [Lutzomyia longipalpis]
MNFFHHQSCADFYQVLIDRNIHRFTNMIVPECIDREFFVNVLKSGLKKQDFDLIKYDIELGCAPGDNYCSTIYRVVISYREDREKKVQCIVKFILNDGAGKAMMERTHVYEKEVGMLSKNLPKLTKLAGGTQFGPMFYHTINDENGKIIVMEDLGETGYKMANRQLLLDYDQCALVLKKLGELHGTSLVLGEEDPSCVDMYDQALLEGSVDDPGIVQMCLGSHFNILCDIVKTWPGYEEISKKLDAMNPKIWELLYASTKRDKDQFRVLNHGDFWINNFLFKNDESTGKPIDCIFVDLQFSYYTSPAHDLQYFFNTSPTAEIRENQREELLRVYYGAFKKTLESLKYPKIPTFDDLLVEMKKREMYGFFALVYIQPAVLMERQSEQGSGIEGLVNEEAAKEIIKIMFSGKRFTEVLKSSIKRFDKVGLFDI